jgi:hypothetical protein
MFDWDTYFLDKLNGFSRCEALSEGRDTEMTPALSSFDTPLPVLR